MENSITSKLRPLYEALKIDVSSISSSISSDVLVSRVLNKAVEMKGIKKYHQLVVDSMRILPFEVASLVKTRFKEIVNSAIQFLAPIEQHLDQLLLQLSSSQSQLKNMDPTMRQHMQQRMFANMRFGKRPAGVRPPSSGVPNHPFQQPKRDGIFACYYSI